MVSMIVLGMHGTGGGMWGGMGWIFMLLMMLFWLLVLIALAGGVYWVFTRLFRNGRSNGPTSDSPSGGATDEALRILNERYARGEIDDDEYAERKRRLEREE